MPSTADFGAGCCAASSGRRRRRRRRALRVFLTEKPLG
jgi:hypothetical protein